MNTFSTRTRRGAAILFSGVLVFGGLALTSEASAVQFVPGNPTCASLGYEYEYKSVENPIAGYYPIVGEGMDANLQVGTYTSPDPLDPNSSPNTNNAIIGYSISTSADGYAVIVKGGNGANVYPRGELTNPMHAPAVPSEKWPTISHFQLCWNGPPEPGEIEVTKVVLGTDTPGDYTFEICVTPVDTDGDPLCKKVVGNGTLTFENLPPGKYVVTETDPGPRFSVKGSGETVTVRTEDTTEATVTNTWIPPGKEFGRVEMTKLVTGQGAPNDGVYEICLTGPDPSTTKECKTLVGEGTVTFEDLVPGTYKVTETEPGAEYAGPEYTATIDPAAVEVTAGGVAKAIVTNEYTKEESLPPTVPEAPVTPTAPVTPATPATPTAPVTPAATTEVAAQTALPSTGSEGGLAAIAAILVTTGLGLTLLGKRRGTQQA